MKQFSIRSLLGLSLLLLVLLPAIGLGYLLIQRDLASVDELASRTLREAALRGQTAVQAHLRHATRALDGMAPEGATSPQRTRTSEWVSDPALFAPMAIALARSSPDLRFIYFTGADGRTHGVENAADGLRFGGRGALDNGARVFSSSTAKSPLRLAETAGQSAAPGNRPWTDAALQGKARVFSPVTLSTINKQLLLTVSQPVYDGEGAVAGVLGVDLRLEALSSLLRTQPVSPNGVAYVVDENGFLLASSTDTLTTHLKDGQPALRTPHSSTNGLVRASYAAVEQQWAAAPGLRENPADHSVRLANGDEPLFSRVARVGSADGLQWRLVVAAPEGDFRVMSQSGLIALLMGIGALMLAGGLIGVYSANHMANYLLYLRRGVESLHDGFALDRVPPTPVQELAALTQAMVDCNLQRQDRNFDSLAGPVTYPPSMPLLPDGQVQALQDELFARTTELAAARDLAMSATRSKSAFLAVISHELRTPLNGVVGMGSLLAHTTLNEEQRNYLRILSLSSQQLQSVFDEILEFSRTHSGELFLRTEPLNVRDVVVQACESAVEPAQAKGLQLLVDVPGEVFRPGRGRVPWVTQGDPTRLAQVVSHLLLNAVKFTEAGSISVKVRPFVQANPAALPMLEVRVQDTGQGIASDQLGNIFLPFTQLDSSTSRKHSGTGLGLATCKRLVELMGGEINVESKPGKGSLFWFTALAPWADTDAVAEDAPEVEMLTRPVATDQETSTPAVLVVDDNPINLEVACAMLLKLGYKVLKAKGGQEAIDSVAAALERGEWLGAVLMDVHMPEVDGIEATRAIVSAHGKFAPPIIALTAGDSREDMQRCMDAGMVEYLTKPLQLRALVKALDHWVKGETTQPRNGDDANEEAPPSRSTDADMAAEAPTPMRFSDTEAAMPMGLVDFDRLNEFREFDDPELTMTREVIGLLIHEAPVHLASIEQAIMNGDAERLSLAAHSLRGTASNVGALTLQHLCGVLERATDEAKAVPDDATSYLVALRFAWRRTRPLLENWH